MEPIVIMSKWNGELDVDNADFRRKSFDAWLNWEFLQRCLTGSEKELSHATMGELCGKNRKNVEVIVRRSKEKARNATIV